MASASIGAGLAQIPGSDSIPIIAIQTAMIISLGLFLTHTLVKVQHRQQYHLL